MSDIGERLRNCENDPMWADHAEIPKRWCKQAADEIDRLREALILIASSGREDDHNNPVSYYELCEIARVALTEESKVEK